MLAERVFTKKKKSFVPKLKIIYTFLDECITFFFLDGWLGISAVPLQFLPNHFIQFSYIGRSEKVWRSISPVIWFATVWEIWKERHNRLFTDKTCSTLQMVDKIKSLTFMWLKAKYTTLPFNFHDLWLSPFTILGIG